MAQRYVEIRRSKVLISFPDTFRLRFSTELKMLRIFVLIIIVIYTTYVHTTHDAIKSR